jgi:uncharacterized membrane protein (DUF485 family)
MTISKLQYLLLSFLLAIIVFVLNFKYDFSSNMDMDKLMDKAIDFASISFGFLLAVLALIIQSDSPALQRIIESERFKELIGLNKRAVLSSALLCFTALIYIGFKISETQINISGNVKLHHVGDSLCLAIFIYQITEVLLFLDIFYTIIKQKK